SGQGHVAISKPSSGKRREVNAMRRSNLTTGGMGVPRRPPDARAKTPRKAGSGPCGAVSVGAGRGRRPVSVDEEAETRGGQGGRLAWHGLGQTLALERRGQVGFAMAGKETGKEFHDTSPCKVWSYTERPSLDGTGSLAD